MRVLSIVISALLLVHISIAQNLDKQLADLGLDIKDNSQTGGSIFASLFNAFQSKSSLQKAGEKQSIQDGKDNSRQIFNTLNSLDSKNKQKIQSLVFKGMKAKNDGGRGIDFQLPYQALLPRRRMPLQINFQKKQRNALKNKHDTKINLQDLFQLLNKQQSEGEQVNKVQWQNPQFKDKTIGHQLPFSKIFGSKRKGDIVYRKIGESEVESILIDKMPFLQGGKIIKMTSNHYRKGLFLNIQFQTKQSKIYTIMARYKPKHKKLEIISLKENTNPFNGAAQQQSNAEQIKKQEQSSKHFLKDKNDIKNLPRPLEQLDSSQKIERIPAFHKKIQDLRNKKEKERKAEREASQKESDIIDKEIQIAQKKEEVAKQKEELVKKQQQVVKLQKEIAVKEVQQQKKQEKKEETKLIEGKQLNTPEKGNIVNE